MTELIATVPAMEEALKRSLRWLLPALVVVPLMMLIPDPAGSVGWAMSHLAVVVVFGLALVMRLSTLLSGPWFPKLGAISRSLASAASLVMFATGAVALLTLASSAALRFDPSLQFLQLLSALDIAWSAGATAVGLTMLRGRAIGWFGGSMVVAVCLWSVWRYLNVVGLTPAGGWLVEADAMWTYILPYDIAVALIAVTVLTLGARHLGVAMLVDRR